MLFDPTALTFRECLGRGYNPCAVSRVLYHRFRMTPTYRLLQTAEEVDQFLTDDDLNSALDWFDDEPKMGTEEFLDRLFPRYGGPSDSDDNELDLDQLDNAAARRIMARARKLRKERDL